MLVWLLGCPSRDVFFTESGASSTGADAAFDVAVHDRGVDQARVLTVRTPEPSTVMVTWFDEDGVRRLEHTDARRDHQFDVLGLPAGQRVDLEITAFFEGRRGGAAQVHQEIEVPPLPAWFPELTATLPSDVDGTDVFLHLVSDDGLRSVAAVVRGDGRVAWHWAPPAALLAAGCDGARFAAVGGDPIETWQPDWTGAGEGMPIVVADPLALHDVVGPLSDDRLLTLERRLFQAPWPGRPEAVPWRDETARMTSYEGSPHGEVGPSAFWPTSRLGRARLDPATGEVDWTGARAASWDHADVVFSMPLQDAVVKTALRGDPVWALVADQDLSDAIRAVRLAVPDAELPHGPDGAVLGPAGPDGTRLLALVDTGDGLPAPVSRVVGYAVDEAARTARLVFEATGAEPVAARWGDAALGPGGTVFASFGAFDDRGATRARVLEVEPSSGAVLRELDVGAGWTVRAIAGLPPLETLGAVGAP